MKTGFVRNTVTTRRAQAGVGLVELLVVVLISLLMLAGLFSIVYGTRQNYLAQNQLAQLQDSERLAMNLITSIVQTGGYFPNPTANTLVAALPASGLFASAGQAYFGVTVATGDQLYVRYVAGTNDGVMDCNGNTNGTANPLTNVNLFYVANNQLMCQVTANGVAQVAQPLANGVTGMTILYGVNVNNDGNSSAEQYLSAAAMTPAYWNQVVSLRITLTFANPLTGQTAPGPGQFAAPTLSRTIDLLNRI
ncbi:MAG TPA: PilW family protein [Burkholderiaceae bacterium]|nr:PilW family protein [Burkholderiaceae bacterium]